MRIDLGDGEHTYACQSTDPLVIFLSGTFREMLDAKAISALSVAFKLWVHKDAITTGRWPVVGSVELTPELIEEPTFWKQDSLTGRLSLYHSSFADTNWEKPASLDECRGLECAAVWNAEHVESRLRDLRDGKENIWMKSLQIKQERIPANNDRSANA